MFEHVPAHVALADATTCMFEHVPTHVALADATTCMFEHVPTHVALADATTCLFEPHDWSHRHVTPNSIRRRHPPLGKKSERNHSF
jgi:hypothetical protein